VHAPRRGTGPLPCKLARAAGRKFPLAPPASDADGSAAVWFLLLIFETQARVTLNLKF